MLPNNISNPHRLKIPDPFLRAHRSHIHLLNYPPHLERQIF